MFLLLSADTFQENVLKTILKLEKVYFDLAEKAEGNVIVVCDRGAMDSLPCMHIIWVGVEERARVCVWCLCVN